MNKKILEVSMKMLDKISPALKRMSSSGSKDLNKLSKQSIFTDNSLKKMISTVKNLTVVFLGLMVINKVVQWFKSLVGWLKESVRLASIQGEAVDLLAASMKKLNVYTKEGFEDLQNFASEMQRLTAVEDDVTLRTLKTLRVLTKLDNEGLKAATKATIGLAKTFGMDMKAATVVVGKSLGSTVNALSRYGVVLDTTASQSDKVAQLTKYSAAMFALAEVEAKTYTGTMQNLSNSWGDFREAVGAFVTQSPGFLAVIQEITKWLDKMGKGLTKVREESGDIVGLGFAKLIQGAIRVIIFFERFYQASIKLAQSFARIDYNLNLLKATMASIIGDQEGFDKFVQQAAQAGVAISILEGQIESIETTIQGLNQLIIDVNNAVKNAVDPVKNVSESFDMMADSVDKTAKAMEDLKTSSDKIWEHPILKALGTSSYATATIKLKNLIEAKRLENIEKAKWESLPKPLQNLYKHYGVKPGDWHQLSIKMAKDRESKAPLPTEVPNIWQAGLKTLGRNENLWSMGASAVQGGVSGGAMGAIQSVLPMVGSAFGPAGSAIGLGVSLLMGLFGKKRRGETRENPVYVEDIKTRSAITELLNITKVMLAGSSKAGIQDIGRQIKLQGGRTV